jgi:hypothetical protein
MASASASAGPASSACAGPRLQCSEMTCATNSGWLSKTRPHPAHSHCRLVLRAQKKNPEFSFVHVVYEGHKSDKHDAAPRDPYTIEPYS